MSHLRRIVLIASACVLALAYASPATAQFRPPRRTPPIPPRPQPAVDQPAVAERPVEIEIDAAPAGPTVDPALLRLHLRDGSVIVGTLTVENITVATEFGALTVPVTMLRGFKPGLQSHSDLRSRLGILLAELGGDDYRRRETAQQELLALGPQVRAALQPHAESENAELSRRVKLVLSELAREAESFAPAETAAARAEWIEEDAVETMHFTAVGAISPRTLAVATPYGTLSVDLADVAFASRPAAIGAPTIKRSTFSVAATYLAQLKFKSSGLRIERGDEISVSASGSINRTGAPSQYASTPAGSNRLGAYQPNILGGTLVARIGNGPVIKVGTKARFTADRSGLLQFAIAMRPEYVGGYQFHGQYHVEASVRNN